MLYFFLFTVWWDYYFAQTAECSSATDGGTHCYSNCTPTALRYYGTCNYTHFCNYVALNTNYNCVSSYVILPNGSYSYYVAGIYVTGGVGYMQSGTCQYCNSVTVGGEIDINCFESSIGGPWTNAQKRTATDEDNEEFISTYVKDPSLTHQQASNSANMNSYNFNTIKKRRSESTIEIEDKITKKPKQDMSQLIRSDDMIQENNDLCNLLGFCDSSWHCRLAGSSLSYPINLSSCCFALLNLNLQCACSPIAAALGLYPPPPLGWLGFVCLP